MDCKPGQEEILELLPHRDPFLLVDSISERGEGWIETEWHVAEDMDVFRGHYPGNPVLPGVLISEHCFQSAALLIFSTDGGSEQPAPAGQCNPSACAFEFITKAGQHAFCVISRYRRFDDFRFAGRI